MLNLAYNALCDTFYFGFKGLTNLKEIADNPPDTAWPALSRPPRYEVQTDPRRKPIHVKRRIIRARE